ncbi:von Willebrand factor type A [Methylocella silvestris BL2]|uniref:von Willebrand factor type A n=1 Tax=Methylocella silvestris (strain DSM 15510 / CIP 108128 / LMG 27833 / NCIMB 13906 / BL2) TaxID=395965 RepID=B8EKM7_METSB|nr:VWA domain-containing protein [Methylocella silvestris]ACK51397.1 von Willebrand factor type A [Methylocella silvestris BL2]
MIAFGSFALLRPWWLLALPLAAMAFYAIKTRGGGLGQWERAVDPPLLSAMARRGLLAPGGKSDLAPALWALVVLALALSGPALKRRDADRFRNLDANLILVDLSSEATDRAQLRQATTAAHLALEAGAARQTGLIVYAGDAYLAAPMTDDSAATGSLIFALDGETVPDPGVRPDRALALARRLAANAKIVAGDVTVISSGAGVNEAALSEARALAAAGLKVHTLFASQDSRGESGQGAGRAALAKLAAAGAGVAADAGGPSPVTAAIAGRAIRRLGGSSVASLYWRDYGRYLAFAACLPLLLAFRRIAR